MSVLSVEQDFDLNCFDELIVNDQDRPTDRPQNEACEMHESVLLCIYRSIMSIADGVLPTAVFISHRN